MTNYPAARLWISGILFLFQCNGSQNRICSDRSLIMLCKVTIDQHKERFRIINANVKRSCNLFLWCIFSTTKIGGPTEFCLKGLTYNRSLRIQLLMKEINVLYIHQLQSMFPLLNLYSKHFPIYFHQYAYQKNIIALTSLVEHSSATVWFSSTFWILPESLGEPGSIRDSVSHCNIVQLAGLISALCEVREGRITEWDQLCQQSRPAQGCMKVFPILWGLRPLCSP